MIELFRRAEDPEADRIEDALNDLVVAHRVVVCTPSEAQSHLGTGVTLPALREDARVASGPEAIARFLGDTSATLERWRQFQTDACYLDDDGNVC